MSTIAIIPARYASTRFPGKPLALLNGRPVIQWVYESVRKAFDDVLVATDDRRVADAVAQFGGEVVVTSAEHKSGTSRVEEAYRIVGSTAQVVVNVQGDEPFVNPENLYRLAEMTATDDAQISTMVSRVNSNDSPSVLFDPNRPKVVLDHKGEALYFSRSPIPYIRNFPPETWLQHSKFFLHIGVYAFNADVLRRIVHLPPSSLEIAESLEQLRWLEYGYRIRTLEVADPPHGIDTPADLEAAQNYLNSLNHA